MASAVVVLKHETSTIRQRHNFISIDLTFGVSDYIREVTSPDKVGSGPMSGRDATWGQHILCLFIFNRAITHTRDPIFAHNSSKDSVWCKEDPFRDEKCVILKFGVYHPKNTPKFGRKGQLPAKIKCRITPKRYEIREMCH